MQTAGRGLAKLAACRTSLRELSIRGVAPGRSLMAGVAGARSLSMPQCLLLHAWAADRCNLHAAREGPRLKLLALAAGFVNLTSLRLRTDWEPGTPRFPGIMFREYATHYWLPSLHRLTSANGGTRCAVAQQGDYLHAALPPVPAGPTLRAPP